MPLFSQDLLDFGFTPRIVHIILSELLLCLSVSLLYLLAPSGTGISKHIKRPVQNHIGDKRPSWDVNPQILTSAPESIITATPNHQCTSCGLTAVHFWASTSPLDALRAPVYSPFHGGPGSASVFTQVDPIGLVSLLHDELPGLVR